MLLSLTTTRAPATDLSWILVKHPERVHPFDTSFGSATVFFPEATEARCTAVLVAEASPVDLVRGKKNAWGALTNYVNDRPYASGSFLSVALNRAFRSAMSRTNRDRPDLVDAVLPLRVELPAVSVRGGLAFLGTVFEPLGYTLSGERIPLDPERPEWGPSRYCRVVLEIEATVATVLNHLYVLLPVLDDAKHYWVDEAEVAKLVDRAGDWLATHPAREAITTRYLKRQRPLVRDALSQLIQADPREAEADEERKEAREVALEKPLSLNRQRLDAVTGVVRDLGARRVLDLGCGGGKLLRRLLELPTTDALIGADVSMRALDIADRRVERLPEALQDKLTLIQGSATYRDKRFADLDCVCLVEVVEHIDAERLPSVEAAVFGHAHPKAVVVTTPNVEYNAVFGMTEGTLRHDDHRWEWDRSTFATWAERVATEHGYSVHITGIGPEDPARGCPTQMGVFRR